MPFGISVAWMLMPHCERHDFYTNGCLDCAFAESKAPTVAAGETPAKEGALNG